MLELISLILTLFVLAYVVRTLIFLYRAWAYSFLSGQIAISTPALSPLITLAPDKIHSITPTENLVFHDSNVKQTAICTHIESNASHLFLPVCARTEPPIVSLIIPTHNEESVIEPLLKSLESLTYDKDRFEIIIVDDSTDRTADILEQSKNRFENLTMVKRTERHGWKGGALNLALQSIRDDSLWTIIVDADTILPPDIIEKFLHKASKSNEMCIAIQGYCLPYNNSFCLGIESSNWISKGIEFRLAQRNIVEFVAKEKLGLPLQITGSLFMIRTSMLKEIGFSTDVCEDWDLSLRLFLRQAAVVFDENLNAASQTTTSFASYFKQRLRVSEGHTRGFFKHIPEIVKQRQSLKNKVEVCFTGLHYLKLTFIACILLLDIGIISISGLNLFSVTVGISLSIQIFCLISIVAFNILCTIICARIKKYTPIFLMSKLALDICTFPAVVIGTLLVIFRENGNFYKTERI